MLITNPQKIETGQLAVGMKVPNTVKDPKTFLLDAKEYDPTVTHDIINEIELSKRLYRYEGMIGNAIDIMVEFANTKLWAEDTGDEKLNIILEHFNNHVNKNNTNTLTGTFALAEKFFNEFLLCGNVFPYCYWESVSIDKNITCDIPISIIDLNPKHIRIETAALALGQEIIYFTPNYDLQKIIRSDGRSSPESMPIKKMLPKNLVRKIRSNKKWNGEILLNNDYVTHIKRKASDYEAWGIPFLTRTFSAISRIKKIFKLEESTIEGMITLLTVFKVGSDEYPASPGRIGALQSLLSDPHASTTLVWAHDLEVDQYGPDGKVLAFKDKYKEAYEELKRCFGIAPGLLGEAVKVTYEDLLAMTARLENNRKILKQWMDTIYRQIAVENGFYKIYPKCRMERMNLYNDTAIKTMVGSFYDRGLLDPKTALTEAGYNYDSVLQSKKSHKKEEKYFEPPKLPFSGEDTKRGIRTDDLKDKKEPEE
jgi:hypothetical protein